MARVNLQQQAFFGDQPQQGVGSLYGDPTQMMQGFPQDPLTKGWGMDLTAGIQNPLAQQAPPPAAGGFMPNAPQVPQPGGPMPDLNTMLNSPGAAMAGSALQNLANTSMGQYGRQVDPIQAYQQAVQNRSIMEMKKKAQEAATRQSQAQIETARQKNAIDIYKMMNPEDSAGVEKMKLYMRSLGLNPEDPAALQDPRVSEFLKGSGGVKVDINNNPLPPNPLTEAAGMDSKAAQDAFRDNLVALPNLLNIGAGFKPEFLTSIGQTKQEWNAFRDRVNGGALNDQEKQTLTEYTQFQNQVEQYFNAYKKAITGAAGSEKELEGIRKSIFNMDQGPTAFQASLENLQEQIARDLRGAIYLQSQGKAEMGTPEMQKELAKRGAADFTSDQYMDAVGDYIANTLGYDPETLTDAQGREIFQHLKRLGFAK